MVGAVIVMLVADRRRGAADHRRLASDSRAGDPAARDHRLGPARIPRQPAISIPVSQLAKWKTTLQLVASAP
jgi:hypothetical protein